jgi:hypothetical protein
MQSVPQRQNIKRAQTIMMIAFVLFCTFFLGLIAGNLDRMGIGGLNPSDLLPFVTAAQSRTHSREMNTGGIKPRP